MNQVKIKNFRTFVIFLFLSTSVLGQKVTYNHIVNPNDQDTTEVMTLFENYLSSKYKKIENSSWNLEELEKYENYDFLENEFQPSLYMGFPVHVLSIKFNKNICEIKAQFSYCKDDGSPYILAIVNYYAKKQNGIYKLYNALNINKLDWNCTTVGLIDFYYPKYHKLNFEKAYKLNDFIIQTCEKFKVKPKTFDYYLADSYDEIQKLKGIDYYIGMGGKLYPKGVTDTVNNNVYCGGLGEYYLHEVFHVQIDQHYPNKHLWVSEGLATLLGGSRGENLNWHIKRTNSYLQDHPEINLNNMLALKNLDDQTTYHYVLGGLIAKKILEKGGWNLVIEFMSSGKTDDDYYNAIQKYLGIKRLDINNYLRKQLLIESKY